MTLTNAGIYLWLILFNIGENIRDTFELERTWFDFDTVEECVTYADESLYIWNAMMDNPGKDWVFALCLDPETANRTYILPTYPKTQQNPTGETPIEQQEVISSFEWGMENSVLPEVTGLDTIPAKKFIWKSWD
tara:strand:- start:1935 stop:2336 length:402 start_codon:yes stop_codon:yes gene_type:complete